MPYVPDASALAFDLAQGCTNILLPLLRFLGGPTVRDPAVHAAVFRLLLVLLAACLAAVIVTHFAAVVLAYLQLTAPAPATASSGYLWRFVVLVFTLLLAWLVVFSVQLAAFSFLGASKPGIRPGFSWNVLS